MPTTMDGQHTCADTCEHFNYLLWTWCVTYVQQLITADTTAAVREKVDISGMDPFVGLNQPPGTATLMGYRNLNAEHAANADLNAPIIVAAIYDNDGTEASKMVIDGWHRIYLARTRHLDALPAHVLTKDTSEAARIATYLR